VNEKFRSHDSKLQEFGKHFNNTRPENQCENIQIAKEILKKVCLFVSGPANATNMQQFPVHMTSGKVSKFIFYQQDGVFY
jgi:hypothetical protein